MNEKLRFDDSLTQRPKPSGIDVECTLQHFSIITYAIDPRRLEALAIPKRFELETVRIDGQDRALLSVVPFKDADFTSAVFSFPKFTMGQTNYRIYIRDLQNGRRCVWFLGTTLDSWSIFIPRSIWKLPWHPGKVVFDCEFDEGSSRYFSYRMATAARWAPAAVELGHEGSDIPLPGFPDLETGLVCLTHPLMGYYFRRDGKVGCYRVWHDRLDVTPGKMIRASFGLLARLGLVNEDEQQSPYSVLIQPQTTFTIYLPPRVVR